MKSTKYPEVSLCILEETDARQLAELANNKKIYDNVRDFFPHPYTVQNALEFISYCADENPKLTFGIRYANELCGVIGLILQTDVYHRTAEIGYWLGESFWGKGIAPEALKLMIKYAFHDLGLVRLNSAVFEHNKASMRVLEKCGFDQEAIFRKSVIKNELILDEYRYGLVNPDFEGT